jgi:hypothetical protein
VQTAELDRENVLDAPLDSRIDAATLQNGGVRKSVSFGSTRLASSNRYFTKNSLATGFDYAHDGVEAKLRHLSSGVTPEGAVQVSSEGDVTNWRTKNAKASLRQPEGSPKSAQARLETLKESEDLHMVEIDSFRER